LVRSLDRQVKKKPTRGRNQSALSGTAGPMSHVTVDDCTGCPVRRAETQDAFVTTGVPNDGRAAALRVQLSFGRRASPRRLYSSAFVIGRQPGALRVRYVGGVTGLGVCGLVEGRGPAGEEGEAVVCWRAGFGGVGRDGQSGVGGEW
jgi:hypothetical protein